MYYVESHTFEETGWILLYRVNESVIVASKGPLGKHDRSLSPSPCVS